MLASTPEVVYALTGIDLQKIMANLGAQAEKATEPSTDGQAHVKAYDASAALQVIDHPPTKVASDGQAQPSNGAHTSIPDQRKQ